MKKEIKPLNFKIDTRSALPVYEQVKQEIKLLITSGYLEEGDQLVPVRELAANLRINVNTIVKVYFQLDVEGYIYSQPGSGFFVRAQKDEKRDERLELFEQITEDYISKALKLGYSLEEMADKLKKRIKEAVKKTKESQINNDGRET